MFILSLLASFVFIFYRLAGVEVSDRVTDRVGYNPRNWGSSGVSLIDSLQSLCLSLSLSLSQSLSLFLPQSLLLCFSLPQSLLLSLPQLLHNQYYMT
jgi:hypothetical protein